MGLLLYNRRHVFHTAKWHPEGVPCLPSRALLPNAKAKGRVWTERMVCLELQLVWVKVLSKQGLTNLGICRPFRPIGEDKL